MTVYFVQAGEGGPVKIGYAANVKLRLASLQTGSHVPLRVIRVIDGTRATERNLHQIFAARRLAGEWFSFDPAMLDIASPDIATAAPITKTLPRRHTIKQIPLRDGLNYYVVNIINGVNAFCLWRGVTPFAVARAVMNDGKFFVRLANRGDTTSDTMLKIKEYLRSQGFHLDFNGRSSGPIAHPQPRGQHVAISSKANAALSASVPAARPTAFHGEA